MDQKVNNAPFTNRSEALNFLRTKTQAEVIKIGETQHEVRTEKGSFHINDNCKTLSVAQRQALLFLIFCLGLPISLIIIFLR